MGGIVTLLDFLLSLGGYVDAIGIAESAIIGTPGSSLDGADTRTSLVLGMSVG